MLLTAMAVRVGDKGFLHPNGFETLEALDEDG